jgi:hypothetical protein
MNRLDGRFIERDSGEITQCVEIQRLEGVQGVRTNPAVEIINTHTFKSLSSVIFL